MPFDWWTDAVTVTRPAQVSSRGTTVADWEHATTTTLSGVDVQVPTTILSLDGRTATALGGTIYAPMGADVQAGDRIGWHDLTFEVDGEPKPWRSPTGAANNIQIPIKYWRG